MKMEWNSFYSNACYECGNWGEGYPLNYCKNCRAVGFCERDTKKDNSKHKELCEILTELRGQSTSVFSLNENQELSQDSWIMMKTNLMLITQLRLGRKLNKQEEEVLKFPKKCISCYEVDPDKLINCKLCPASSYCSLHVQTKEEHAERCKKLIECAASDVFYSPMLRRDIPSISNDKNIVKLPENMEQFLKICGPNFVPFPHNVQTSANSEVFTRPLSLLYGIEKIDYDIKDKLTVHIVGANAADLEDPSTFEIILHYRPNLKEFTLIFIGPDLQEFSMPLISAYLCKECKENDIKFETKVHPIYYHDYAESKEFIVPDIIIGYNIGVHEYVEFDTDCDTWAPTIKMLGKISCPLIVTAYTQEEAQKDHERILRGSDNFLEIFRDKNPFSSLRHYRDFENEDFYYQNQYIMIYKRKEEGREVIKEIENLKLTDDTMICD